MQAVPDSVQVPYSRGKMVGGTDLRLCGAKRCSYSFAQRAAPAFAPAPASVSESESAAASEAEASANNGCWLAR